MPLLLQDKYSWDTWFLPENDIVHAVFLESRKTGKPDDRHTNRVSIGYATSSNLMDWQYHGCVLEPSEWYDAVALWSGCMYKKDDTYYLFYTGRYDADHKQCICLATSTDLKSWTKHPNNPILMPEGKLYSTKMEPNALGKIGAFRDPFVFEYKGAYYMAFFARTPGRTEYNGCVGLARSNDLVSWELLPPLKIPGWYDEMEVPQIIIKKQHIYVLFSIAWKGLYAPLWQEQVGEHVGLHGFYARDLGDDFVPVNKNAVICNNAEEVYDIQIVHFKDNVYGIGWNNLNLGLFIGGISEPFVFHFNGGFVGAIKPNITPDVPVKIW